MKRLRHTAPIFAGIVGPLLFLTTATLIGALRDGYNPRHQFISELGEAGGQLAGLMNYAGFMLSAALIFVFVVSFPARFSKSWVTRTGTFFLALFATCLFLAGVFSCDTGCPTSGGSLEQQLHDIVSIIAFPALVLGVITWGCHLVRRPEWKRFGYYSLATAAASALPFVAMIRSEASRVDTGVYQRLFLAILFLWLVLLATRLSRSGGTVGTGSALD